MAATSMMAQVEALLPVESEMSPAAMPPAMPPTSNSVERYAAVSGLTLAERRRKIKRLECVIIHSLSFIRDSTVYSV